MTYRGSHDNTQLSAWLYEAHIWCSERGDLVTASLLENWLEEVEGRTWFLFEIMHDCEEA
jgi:starvation-inducible DNA-binding protein